MACHSEIAAGIDYTAFAVSFSLTLSLLCYPNLSFGQSLIPVSQCCVASFTFGALQLQLTPLLVSYNWFTSQSWKCYCLFVVLLLHRLELIYSGNLLCFLFEIHGFLQISKLQPNVVTSRTCLQPHKLCVVAQTTGWDTVPICATYCNTSAKLARMIWIQLFYSKLSFPQLQPAAH